MSRRFGHLLGRLGWWGNNYGKVVLQQLALPRLTLRLSGRRSGQLVGVVVSLGRVAGHGRRRRWETRLHEGSEPKGGQRLLLEEGRRQRLLLLVALSIGAWRTLLHAGGVGGDGRRVWRVVGRRGGAQPILCAVQLARDLLEHVLIAVHWHRPWVHPSLLDTRGTVRRCLTMMPRGHLSSPGNLKCDGYITFWIFLVYFFLSPFLNIAVDSIKCDYLQSSIEIKNCCIMVQNLLQLIFI